MTNINLFEVATRNKVRFAYKGVISVEDLWDLNVQQLDSIFKALSSELKQSQEDSLLNTKTKENKELTLKIEIVKYIVAVKLAEDKAQLELQDKKQQEQKILQLLNMKKDEELQNKSTEELEKMLKDLKK